MYKQLLYFNSHLKQLYTSNKKESFIYKDGRGVRARVDRVMNNNFVLKIIKILEHTLFMYSASTAAIAAWMCMMMTMPITT